MKNVRDFQVSSSRYKLSTRSPQAPLLQRGTGGGGSIHLPEVAMAGRAVLATEATPSASVRPLTILAIAELIERIRPRLLSRWRAHGRNQVWAEDVVADAVERLLVKLAAGEVQFTSEVALLSWLAMTASFVARERGRGRDALQRVAGNVDPSAVCGAQPHRNDLRPTVATPEEQVAHQEALAQFSRLPLSDRQLLLREALGERQEAASGRHRRRLHLARERARRVLEAEEHCSPRRPLRPSQARATEK